MVRIRALVFLLGFVELDGRLEGGREGGGGGVEWSGVEWSDVGTWRWRFGCRKGVS